MEGEENCSGTQDHKLERGAQVGCPLGYLLPDLMTTVNTWPFVSFKLQLRSWSWNEWGRETLAILLLERARILFIRGIDDLLPCNSSF